jgi:hypothetical protein
MKYLGDRSSIDLLFSATYMHELSGGASAMVKLLGISKGGGYAQDYVDSDVKPWKRGPPSPDVAPWQQRGRDGRPRDDYSSI